MQVGVSRPAFRRVPVKYSFDRDRNSIQQCVDVRDIHFAYAVPRASNPVALHVDFPDLAYEVI